MSIYFHIRHYRGDIFQGWCKECLQANLALGSYLVDLLGRPYPPYGNYSTGLPDNVWAAERYLIESEKVGWIVKGDYNPGTNLQFFGVGRSRRGENNLASPVEYDWRPNPASKEFRVWATKGKFLITIPKG